MEYARITVKSDYNKRADLVLRSYIRALIKSNIKELLSDLICDYKGPYLNGDRAYIYGIVDDNGLFHELFTGNIIDYSDYEIVSENEYNSLINLSLDKKDIIRKVIEKVLFRKENDLDINISNMEELAVDRGIEFTAYDRCFSLINPYHFSGENESHDDYDNFLRKIEKINKMKSLDGDSKRYVKIV